MPYVPPPDWTDFDALRRDRQFRTAMKDAIELQQKVDVGEAAKEKLKQLSETVIIPHLTAAGIAQNSTFTFEKAQVRECNEGSGGHLDTDLLLQAGVKRSILDKCFVAHKRKHYLKIVFPKQQQKVAKKE